MIIVVAPQSVSPHRMSAGDLSVGASREELALYGCPLGVDTDGALPLHVTP
jgi:hypothetical protein